MKFAFFHLMPYADLDFDEAAKHRAAWTILPNSLYDPIKGAELYHRYLDELEYADALGFDAICVNEHHQTAYGLMPAPNLFASALARRTKNAKIAVLGRALPLLNNPVTVAEEYAILDNLTKGRFIAGFVRGIGAEYHASPVNPAESRDRFHEAHDMIIRAWTEPGPFSFSGKYYKVNYVNPWPRPYQTPHPPIWIPSQGSMETIEWATAPERKYTYIVTFSPVKLVAANLTAYKDAADRHGWEAKPENIGWALPAYVSDTDESARKEAKIHIERLFNDLLRMPPEMLLPPGHTSIASFKRFLETRKDIIAEMRDGTTVDQLIERGTVAIGSPATVRDFITHHAKEIGFGHCAAMLQFGSLPADLTRHSVELFAKEVIPHVRNVNAVAAE